MPDLSPEYPTDTPDNDREVLLRLTAAGEWVIHAEKGDVPYADAVAAIAGLMAAAEGFL